MRRGAGAGRASTSRPWVSSLAARAVGLRLPAGWTIRSSDGRMRRRSRIPRAIPPCPSPSPSPSRPRPRAWRPPRAVAGAGPPRARPHGVAHGDAHRLALRRRLRLGEFRLVLAPSSGLDVAGWSGRVRRRRWELIGEEEACRRSRSTAAAAGPAAGAGVSAPGRSRRLVVGAGGAMETGAARDPPRGACGGWHRPARGFFLAPPREALYSDVHRSTSSFPPMWPPRDAHPRSGKSDRPEPVTVLHLAAPSRRRCSGPFLHA